MLKIFFINFLHFIEKDLVISRKKFGNEPKILENEKVDMSNKEKKHKSSTNKRMSILIFSPVSF
jgi:hypothetical protein